MTNPIERAAESFGVPWEGSYGYAQAVKHGDTIYVSGQLAHDGDQLVARAPVDANGAVTDFSAMEAQMRRAYENATQLLKRFGASLADVVEEALYMLDIERGVVRTPAGLYREGVIWRETLGVNSRQR